MAAVLTVNDLLDGHVGLDVECMDRIYLNGYVPNLQARGDRPGGGPAPRSGRCTSGRAASGGRRVTISRLRSPSTKAGSPRPLVGRGLLLAVSTSPGPGLGSVDGAAPAVAAGRGPHRGECATIGVGCGEGAPDGHWVRSAARSPVPGVALPVTSSRQQGKRRSLSIHSIWRSPSPIWVSASVRLLPQ
jgi:hypothetical protein